MITDPILQRIQARMEALGWTRAELGRRADIPYHRLNPWFVRDTHPNAEDMAAVASALSVPIGHLVAGDPIEEPSARDLILRFYDGLTDERRRQLQEFAKFLADQQSGPGNERGG